MDQFHEGSRVRAGLSSPVPGHQKLCQIIGCIRINERREKSRATLRAAPLRHLLHPLVFGVISLLLSPPTNSKGVQFVNLPPLPQAIQPKGAVKVSQQEEADTIKIAPRELTGGPLSTRDAVLESRKRRGCFVEK